MHDISLGDGPVREAKLGEQLYRYLVDLIESGKLVAGAKLPTEKQLCEQFRISRPVVREALARLRMERVITSRRGSGSYILGASEPPASFRSPKPSPSYPIAHGGSKLTNLLRCFEMRLMIECDAAHFAALRRTQAHLDGMLAAIDEMEDALRTHSLDHQAHFRFHLIIAEATDNPFIVETLKLLAHHMEVCMNLLRDLWVLEPNQAISTGEYKHIAIYEAIREQKAEEASRAMHLHLEEARREIFGELGVQNAPKNSWAMPV